MKLRLTNCFILLFVLMFCFSGFSSSQSLLDENFNYPAGDSLGAHGWVSFSGGSTNVLTVSTPGLTYAGYPLSNIGNATSVTTSGQDAYKSLSGSDSIGSFYASFMINITSAQIGDYFLAFLPSTSTTFYSGRVYLRSNGGNINFGITKGAGTDTTTPGIWTTGNYSLGVTYLVVLKYTFVTGGTNNDEVSLFVLPSGIPTTEPTPTVGPLTYPSGDAGNIGRIALRQGTSTRAPIARIDGIRVTKSWAGISTSVKNISSVADNFSLSQNYPNPFNPETKINFSIPSEGFVSLTVFNSLGKEVRQLVNEELKSGTYSLNFSGRDLNSGIYFYRINYYQKNSQLLTQTKKLILIK